MYENKRGALLRQLRLERGMTQHTVGKTLHISGKTVSKWECGTGIPDVSLLDALSSLYAVSINDLLAGELSENENTGGNMKHLKYYVCTHCGSISTSSGDASLYCCGRTLVPLVPRNAEDGERLNVSEIDGEWYVSTEHPMTKTDYISFIAFVSSDRMLLFRQYPEWPAQCRIPRQCHGKLLWYSDKMGLLQQIL